jgi:hypothetical protein
VAAVLTIAQTKHSTNKYKTQYIQYAHMLPKHPYISPVVFLEQSALEESENLLATLGVLLLASLDAKNEQLTEPQSTQARHGDPI